MTRFNTGNPINSLAQEDFYDNCLSLDQAMNSTEPTWRDRFNVEKPTIDAALKSAGFMPAGFDFVTGGTLQPGDRNKAVYNPAPNGDNNWYRWNGAFPKEIAANSQPNPKDENNWVPVVVKTGAVEREALRRTYLEAGYNLVEGSFEEGGTLNTISDVILEEKTGKVYSWTGSFPKVVNKGTLPNSEVEWTPEVGNHIRVGKESICYINTWGSDVNGRVNDPNKPFLTIGGALNTVSDAVTLVVGVGKFLWEGALRSGLIIEGSGEPMVNETGTDLVGGTVLYTSDEGGFPGGFGGMRGITFKNLGVLALGKTDGLIIASPAGEVPGSGITIENVVTLAEQTSNHSALIENVENLSIVNMTTYGGVSGLAVKAINFAINNTRHYDASGAYLTLRESPYAKCRNGVVNNVLGVHKHRTEPTSAGLQLLNNEANCEMSGVEVTGVVVSGVISGLLMDNQINTKHLTDVTVNNITCYGSADFAVTINGGTKSVAVNGLTANNCTGVIKTSTDVSGTPEDTLFTNVNIIAGPKSIARPIYNEGIRTSINGIKVNQCGTDIFNPVIENPGKNTAISGVSYTGSIIISTGDGSHSILEGEDLQGTVIGPSTPGEAIAVKRFNGTLNISIRNSILTSGATVITLPNGMKFKPGDIGKPPQIRQNYSVTISGHVNASTPTNVPITLIGFPLTENTFQINVTADPSVIATGIIVSCDLSGVWK